MDPEAEQDPLALTGSTIEGTTYRVERLVGEGGFGCVYVAHDTSLDRKVALKVLRVPSMLSRSDEERMRESFIAEGRLLARLTHPHTVRVFACGYHGKLPYLALEWLDGRNLTDAFAQYQRTASSRLSEAEVLDLLLPAFEALAEAHELGVVHRDIKPDNLFISERPGRQSMVKVLDFGVGKLTELGQRWDKLSTATRAGRVAFTPTYGAPEQFFPKQFGSTGPWTDVHALGLVMIELCTGETAFRQEGPELFVEAARPERPTPRRAGVPVSDAFDDLCGRCVALEPRDRFQNAGELFEAATTVRRSLGGAESTVPILAPKGTAAMRASSPRGEPPPTVPAPASFSGHVPDEPTSPLLSGAKTELSSPTHGTQTHEPTATPTPPRATGDAAETSSESRGRGPLVAAGVGLVGLVAALATTRPWVKPTEPTASAPPAASVTQVAVPSASAAPSAAPVTELPEQPEIVDVRAAKDAPKKICVGRDVGTQDINHGCSASGCDSCWGRKGRKKSQSLWACVGEPGREQCSARTCAGGDFADCSKPHDGVCETVIANDPDNCGACGAVCSEHAAPGTVTVGCTGGKCQYACQKGRGDCDGSAENGCEVTLASTAQHCGACGTDCTASTAPNSVASCVDSKCASVCKTGFGDCDAQASNGCEADLTSSVASCGKCNGRCPPSGPHTTPQCTDGVCSFVCESGFADCNKRDGDGCEVALTTVSDCGACGNACTAPAGATGAVAVCKAGRCATGCKAGYVECADGCCAVASQPMVRDR